ncbi:hypothetical protein GCM10023189_40210 [Nibrella saemangeumensis]|uniref:Integrase catalytic domain-containing protein n=1 Tax=Nibrella saemangeumensis TaxID=1084526 RepID=A0ABP8NAW4_9BACT
MPLASWEFTADKLRQKWVSDITYITTGQGWLYLTAISDLADRKVVGWALSDSLKAVDTSVAAWRWYFIQTNQVIQYTCTEYRDELKGLPVEQV